MKRCTKCHAVKPLDEFYVDYGCMPPRLHSACKVCVRAYARERYHADPDYRAQKLAYYRLWRAAHREEVNAKQWDGYNARRAEVFQRIMEKHRDL